MQRCKPLPITLKHTKECLLQENFDTQLQSKFSFQTNSAKGNMLSNQNNFSNKRNSFIPQINNDLVPEIICTLHP